MNRPVVQHPAVHDPEQAPAGSTAAATQSPDPATVTDEVPTEPGTSPGRRASSLSWPQVRSALPGAFRKLDPRELLDSPVLLIVEIGAVASTVLAVADPSVFAVTIVVWLWATVLFATLAESIAESRGKAQASSLRATQIQTTARRVEAPVDTTRYTGNLLALPTVDVASSSLSVGDVVVVRAGEVIPGDGDVIEGAASVDESAITGESAPVIRESGGDRSAVTGGTVVLSDTIVVRITAAAGSTFVDRMIALVEGSERQRTPNEIALNILLTSLTIIFLLAVVTLQPFAVYSGSRQSLLVLTALLVCLIPTTIGALLSAIGIAGMDRLVQRNVLAMSGRAVEAAGDVDVLLLDKTGTITYGNRQASDLLVAPGATIADLASAARLASLADETPEGRSVVTLVDAGYVEHVAATTQDDGAVVEPRAVQRDHPDERHRREPGRACGHDLHPADQHPQGGRERCPRLGALDRRAHPRPGADPGRRGERIGRHTVGGGPADGRRTRAGARGDPPQGRRQDGPSGTLRRAARHGHPHRHGDR